MLELLEGCCSVSRCRGCQGCIGGWLGVWVCRGQKGIGGIRGHFGAYSSVGAIRGHQGESGV